MQNTTLTMIEQMNGEVNYHTYPYILIKGSIKQ